MFVQSLSPETTLFAVTAIATTIFQNVSVDWDIASDNIPPEHIAISPAAIQCVPHPINHKRL